MHLTNRRQTPDPDAANSVLHVPERPKVTVLRLKATGSFTKNAKEVGMSRATKLNMTIICGLGTRNNRRVTEY
jgi:hypothetical protein